MRVLSVSVTLHREHELPFVATLRGERRSASKLNVVRASLVYPALRDVHPDPLAGSSSLAPRPEGAAAMSVVTWPSGPRSGP